MASNIDPVIMNGSNYVVWAPDMETLLKSKGLWNYMKTMIPDPTDDQEKFSLLMERRMRLWGHHDLYLMWIFIFTSVESTSLIKYGRS
jgi:hypothetical protein